MSVIWESPIYSFQISRAVDSIYYLLSSSSYWFSKCSLQRGILKCRQVPPEPAANQNALSLCESLKGTFLKTVYFHLSKHCHKTLFFFLIYLFLAVLGLRCCARAFSSCGKRGLLFIAVCGLLIAVASLVVEHGL